MDITYICDTNIISELIKRDPNKGVTDWAESISHIYMSVISIEEIYFGLSWKPNEKIFYKIKSFLENYVTILKINSQIATLAGQIRGDLQKCGITRSQADILIAATTQANNLTLVTRNTKDFSNIAIPVLNPFR